MGLLDIVIIILVIAWIGGFSFHVAGSFIHLLLVVAVIMLIFRILSRRRG